MCGSCWCCSVWVKDSSSHVFSAIVSSRILSERRCSYILSFQRCCFFFFAGVWTILVALFVFWNRISLSCPRWAWNLRSFCRSSVLGLYVDMYCHAQLRCFSTYWHDWVNVQVIEIISFHHQKGDFVKAYANVWVLTCESYSKIWEVCLVLCRNYFIIIILLWDIK